ncbi:glycosyltransferase family 1 protein [Leuconostoc mesenteroides]|uniref:glycosyltransferase family 1 protein n=2 Tax=Leuconostoc mesenteroides TaxID=1245 RepID=UPI002952AC3D|nr:glycosyltransferase family 1 protein [Leuconostoc mesenteroides]
MIHFISGIKSGGVEQYLSNYAPYLLKKGFKIYVVYQHEPHKTSLRKLENAGCICVRITNKRKHPIKYILQSIKIIKSINPDIVETHQDLANFFPLIAGRIAGSKIRISHIHSSNTDVQLNSKIITIMKKLILHNATHLIACSVGAGEFIYGNKSFKVIPNAIDVSDYIFNESMREKCRESLNLNDSFVVGHVGRLTRAKNHKRLFKIFRQFKKMRPNAKLLLVGGGELETSLKQLVKKMKIDEDVIFIGETNEVVKYYSAMDFMLIPSLYEGGPIAAVEAQANGLPMILSDQVDHNVIILRTSKLQSLKSSDQDWCQQITKLIFQLNNRIEDNLIMMDTNFNINYIKLELSNYYESIIK